MKEEVASEDVEKVRSFMNSVTQIVVTLGSQNVQVNILKSDIKERSDGADLIYRYQLA